MSETLPNPKKTVPGKPLAGKEKEEPYLKGTFVSVLLLAGFIILLWLLVFGLFLARN